MIFHGLLFRRIEGCFSVSFSVCFVGATVISITEMFGFPFTDLEHVIYNISMQLLYDINILRAIRGVIGGILLVLAYELHFRVSNGSLL